MIENMCLEHPVLVPIC
jgi:hypothetical protein